ncbi:hypothetical protein BMIN_1506 [Bifidobacterium minimum]|uniref:Uncharacterized protein n=1 Tax=Bifidobacterium minimum TaxID=1693 RepID=A0A087BLE0_9BIFI|nr:hypothetical protein BMIN_1506 [Bifidobacterium minimum]
MKGTSLPLVMIVPVSGVYICEINLSRVDFPEPFLPTIPKNSPACMLNEISFSTCWTRNPRIPLSQLKIVVFRLFARSVGSLKLLDIPSTCKAQSVSCIIAPTCCCGSVITPTPRSTELVS